MLYLSIQSHAFSTDPQGSQGERKGGVEKGEVETHEQLVVRKNGLPPTKKTNQNKKRIHT